MTLTTLDASGLPDTSEDTTPAPHHRRRGMSQWYSTDLDVPRSGGAA